MIIGGIDAGGTSTKGILIDESGDILVRETAGPANVQVVGFERAVKEIQKVIEKLLAYSDISEINILGIGIAGAGDQKDIEHIEGILNSLNKVDKVFITNDANIALLGAHEGASGIVLIAGTGSIAYGIDKNGKLIRAGGWGPILGDEGSGYWMGLEALKTIVKAEDERGPDTLLTYKIINYFNISSLRELVTLIHQKKVTRSSVAALVPLIIESAKEGDKAAKDIIDRGIEELAFLVFTLGKKIKEERIKVAVVGGLFNSPLIYNLFCKRLEKKGNYSIVKPLHTPEYGAAIYGMTKAGVL